MIIMDSEHKRKNIQKRKEKAMKDLYLENQRYIQALIKMLESYLEERYGQAFSRAPPVNQNNLYPDITIIECHNGVVASYFEYDIVKNNSLDIQRDQDFVSRIAAEKERGDN